MYHNCNAFCSIYGATAEQDTHLRQLLASSGSLFKGSFYHHQLYNDMCTTYIFQFGNMNFVICAYIYIEFTIWTKTGILFKSSLYAINQQRPNDIYISTSWNSTSSSWIYQLEYVTPLSIKDYWLLIANISILSSGVCVMSRNSSKCCKRWTDALWQDQSSMKYIFTAS